MAQHTPFHFSNLFDTPIQTVKSWFDPKDVKRENSIVIDKKNHKLVYYDKDGKVKQTTSIATGKNPGTKRKEGDLKTPVGNFRIVKYNNDADASYYGNNNFFGLTGGEGIGIQRQFGDKVTVSTSPGESLRERFEKKAEAAGNTFQQKVVQPAVNTASRVVNKATQMGQKAKEKVVTPVLSRFQQYLAHKSGGSINIKKSNKGKFTEYCGGKVTSECIEKGKHSTSAAVRKRATFADNARKWNKHQLGGTVFFDSVENRIKAHNFNDPRKEDYDNIIFEDSKADSKTESDNWWDKYSTSDNGESATSVDVAQATTPESGEKQVSYDFTTSGEKYDKLEDSMKQLIQIFEEEGVPIRITSGWRLPGAVGKAGNRSHHVHGGAIDIVPADGSSFDDVAKIMATNPRIKEYMQNNNIGYIDETSDEAMSKTGATGKHFHVGPDQWALRDYAAAIDRFGSQMAKNGGTLNHTNVFQTGGKVYFDSKDDDYENPESTDPRKKDDETDNNNSDDNSEVTFDNWWEKYINPTVGIQSEEQRSQNEYTRQSSSEEQDSSSTEFSTDGSWADFRDQIYDRLTKLGISDEVAKTMTAQMGLETGHGKHIVGDYNYGNITKGNWTGKTKKVSSNPREFRSYDNIDQGLTDYIKLNEAYDIQSGDSKDQVYSKWLGNNGRGLAWNGKNNQEYKKAIDKVYNMYWNK